MTAEALPGLFVAAEGPPQLDDLLCYNNKASILSVEGVTMKAEEIYQFLQLKPFQPVRVQLRDGQSHEIRFRELAIVGTTFLDIGIPEPNETLPIYDSVVRVPVEDIVHLEHLSNSTSSARS